MSKDYLNSAYPIEPFQFPSPIEGCNCVVCTRAGVDPPFIEPPSIFESYHLQAVTDHGIENPTHQESNEFNHKIGQKFEWVEDGHVRAQPWYKFCSQILKQLIKHRDSRVFRNPVDYIALGLPDYPQIIKHPMDLGTVDRRLHGDPVIYTNPDDFISDVRFIFRNAYLFNPEGNPVRNMAFTLSKLFEEALAKEYYPQY
eukprot:UN06257